MQNFVYFKNIFFEFQFYLKLLNLYVQKSKLLKEIIKFVSGSDDFLI